MDEERKRLWDVWLGILGPILTVVGLLVGVWQFNRGEHNRVILENELVTKKDQVDFQRRLWQNSTRNIPFADHACWKDRGAGGRERAEKPGARQPVAELTAADWSQSIFVENDDVAGHLKGFLHDSQGLSRGLGKFQCLEAQGQRARANLPSVDRGNRTGGSQTMRRMIGWLGPVLTSLAFCTVANAQSHFQTYFLAVGSNTYIKPNGPAEHGFVSLDDMTTSARLVGDLLSRNGAVSGIVLTSTASSFVSRGDFESALSTLGERIRSDHPTHPLVVVYLAGHGISEGIAWTHFSVPGNFVYGPPLERLDAEAVAQHTIYAAGVADELDRLKVPYMLLLDSCYSGKAADFTSPFLSPTAIDNLRDVAAVLRFVNEFHQSNPVVFSTSPGTEVLPAEDPRDPKRHSLGPIARRLLLLTREATATGANFTLSARVKRLISVDLDFGHRAAGFQCNPVVPRLHPDRWHCHIPRCDRGTSRKRYDGRYVLRFCIGCRIRRTVAVLSSAWHTGVRRPAWRIRQRRAQDLAATNHRRRGDGAGCS